ncbi:gliding motility-associated C-terminal domain-containing protein [Bacteroidota bacterium]
MKTIKRLFLLFIILLMLPFESEASHYMGGEITWECLANGRYRFHLRYYRECAGINYSNTLSLTSNSPAGNISMSLHPNSTAGKTDISPVCNSNPAFPHITCATVTSSNQGAIEEWYYTSDAAYPTGVILNGVPPAGGWFFYNGSCCRNPSTSFTNQPSWRLQAIMYPFNATNTYPCFDSSPTFAEKPATVICTGYPFTYNHFSEDAELDSLAYEWAQPLESTGNPVTSWAFGYSYTSPLPGPTQNPNNVAAVVNPYTGEISFESYTQGAFVTKTKVTAYKCGIKVAEIFREMQVVLLTCGINDPPVVTPPFQNPATGLFTDYTDTVYAGDFVSFPMSGTDFQFLPNSQPQTMSIVAAGSQFGVGYTSTTTGCLNPPCATLTPPPPITGQFGVQTTFNWQTTCAHLATPIGCGATSNLYSFLIKVSDDFCPAPAIKIATVSILVLDQPQIKPPELRCIAVNPNGDVSINWIPVIDTTQSFKSYHVFRSDSLNGTYIQIDSIFAINQSTWTDTSANGQTQPYYYYIKSRSGCFGDYLSISSDTIRTMIMDVVNTGNGTALLSWNPILNPLPPTSLNLYYVYREYPPGSFNLLDSTALLTYEDTITLCNEFVSFKVEIYDSSGCKSVSSIDGDWFQDLTAPSLPSVDTVSVDPVSNKAVIGWSKSLSDDTQGYIIYSFVSGVWTPLDTVYGINNNFYIDASSNPDLFSSSYNVSAFDSCENTSTIGSGHRTIHLTGELAVCDYEIRLQWNSYINMDPIVTGYNIFVSENGSPYSLLSTVSVNDTIYVHNGLTKDSKYCYIVQAYNGSGKTSSSNILCELAHQPGQPQFIYLRYASIENDDHVDLLCFVDTSAFVKEYKVYRSDSIMGPYNLIATIPSGISDHINFDDIETYVHEQSYYYYFSVIDSCGVEVLESNIARTILLTGELLDNFNNIIEWNNYEGWPNGIGSYNIYRSVDYNPLSPLLSVPPSMDNSYQDHIISEVTSGGLFKYFIEANEAFLNHYNFQDRSLSNSVTLNQPPRVFIPNAFVPKGYNSVFKPLAIFVNTDDYIFQVFNRWGGLLFETNNPNEGWVGKFNDEFVQEGVYVYYVRYKTSTGDYFEKRGTIQVIF